MSNPALLTETGFNKKELRSEILIEAPPERVWGVLTDLEKYGEWNPFIRSASGKVERGEKLAVTLRPEGGRELKIKPRLLAVEPNFELRWIGHLGVSGIFDGQHIFELKSVPGGKTVFVQREKFGGILLPFLTGMLRTETAKGFDDMNQALKRRVEGT